MLTGVKQAFKNLRAAFGLRKAVAEICPLVFGVLLALSVTSQPQPSGSALITALTGTDFPVWVRRPDRSAVYDTMTRPEPPLLVKAGKVNASNYVDIDSFIVATMEWLNIPGISACLVKDGEVLWSGAFGDAVIERDIKVSDTTSFMLASISKTVTGVALMQLWEAGLFGLDDDINDYIPLDIVIPDYPDSPITFRTVLTHTASLKDNWEVMDGTYVFGDSPIAITDFLWPDIWSR